MSAVDQGQGTPTLPADPGPVEIILESQIAPKEESKLVEDSVTDVTPKSETVVEQISEKTPEGDDPSNRDDKGRFKGKGLQDRIDELTRSRREAEREAAYWRSRAAGTESAQSPAQSAATSKPPVATDFKTEADFIEALTDYKVEQKMSQRESKVKTEQAVNERATSWQSRLDTARTEITDFNDVMNAAEMPVAGHVAELLLEHDLGAKLSYHFAKNPDALEKVNAMSPAKAAFELATIATTLSKSASKSESIPSVEKSVSKAPAPPTPIGQGRATSPKLEDLQMDDYVAQRRQQGASWAR